MVSPAPIRFNPELLVKNPERLSVAFSLSQCKRLAEFLAEGMEHNGQFTAEFELRRSGRNIDAVGNFETELTLDCQRCLQPFVYPVKTDFKLTLVPDQAAADATEDHVDPVILAEDGTIHVVDLFEDELILQLPTVPKHEHFEQCEFSVPVAIVDSADESPGETRNSNGLKNGSPATSAFAELKNLRFDEEPPES